MNKNYNKPQIEVTAFELEDIITASTVKLPVENEIDTLSAGIEFNIAAGSDEF